MPLHLAQAYPAQSYPARSGARMSPAVGTQWLRLLKIPIYICCFLAFLSDITQEIYISFGLFYLPLICTAVFHRDPRSVWWLALVAISLIVGGFFFPVINPDQSVALTNRTLSIVAVIVTATLVHHARDIQDRLAAQTQRAEAAERMKTAILSTLSDEIRQPLHGLVGLCGVMMADCRPDQRASLGQVQASGKQLIGMIENLIDLTHLDERLIRTEPLDVDRMIHQAVSAMQPIANDKDILLAINAEPGPARVAFADIWAVRRILDNILANALKFSPRGAVIELATETGPNFVELIVRDTGIGMTAEALRKLAAPLSAQPAQDTQPLNVDGTGLTLSRYLARAMGAELLFDSEPGAGTTVTLRLPADQPPRSRFPVIQQDQPA